MRITVPAAAALLIAAASVSAGDIHVTHTDNHEFRIKSLNAFEADDARFEIDGDEILITHLAAPREEIRITESYEVYLDDDRIPLNSQQQQTVEEFYNLSYEIRTEAKSIAKEGVRIGLKGAGLGLKAVGCVLKMLLTGYTEEDLDRDMDFEADKLEAYADELEVRAEGLEALTERWKELGLSMKESIPQLASMDWL